MAAPPEIATHKPHWHRHVSWKQPVRVATTEAGTLATSFENGDTVDAVTLATGDRILVKDQAAGAENGVYVVAATGAPARAYDMDASGEVVGAMILVVAGTANGGSLWRCTNTAVPTLGTTAIAFALAAGTAALDDLTDVDAPAPDDGDVLTWDDGDGEWVAAPSGAGIPATLFDAKGDIIVASADDTAARLAAGTNGYLLKANSGATNGVEWAAQTAVIAFVVDGGGSEIADGVAGFVEVPFACTITAGRLLADQSGSIVVDVWLEQYADYPPTDADTITASAPLTITTAVKSEDTTLTGWTKTIAAGDILGFNVDSCTTIERVTVSLTVTRT